MLQLKNLDQEDEDEIYEISEVYNTARIILKKPLASQALLAPFPQATSITQPSAASTIDAGIKKEDLTSLFTEFTKTLVTALSQAQGTSTRPPSNRDFARALACLMCDGPHLVNACDVVLDYIKAGKCRRNHEGKVVLSTGAYVPREIPGKNLKERIDEWHNRNPGQLAAATLFNAINMSTKEALTLPRNTTFQFTTDDRIATLEAELFNLKNKKTNANPIRTRAQKARMTTTNDDDDDDAAEVAAARASKSTAEASTIDNTPTQSTSTPQPVTQEHPFRNAKDAAYVPPVNKPTANNVSSVPQVPAKKPEQAYRTLPPIHDANIATDVYKRAMESPITITQRELLSLSPEVRSQVREATSGKRVQNKENATATVATLQADDIEDEDIEELVSAATFAVPNAVHRTPPIGATIIPDQYDIYLKSLKLGQEPDPNKLLASNIGTAVRSIHALVDNQIRKECIVDSGSQIIAMSERVCHELALAYDPSVRLYMQSANGQFNQSLGLARNVPFRIGTLTFYLQVHVLKTPAYDILLGRPFDILTESIVRNFANEDQTITIFDPNSGRRVTVPTFPSSSKDEKKEDF